MSGNSGLIYRGSKLTTNGDTEASNDHQIHFGNTDDSSESHIGASAPNYSQNGQRIVYQTPSTMKANNLSNQGTKSTQDIINSGVAARNARRQTITTFGAITSKQTQLAGDDLIPGSTTVVVHDGDDCSVPNIVSGTTVIDVENQNSSKKPKRKKSGNLYFSFFSFLSFLFFLFFSFLYY